MKAMRSAHRLVRQRNGTALVGLLRTRTIGIGTALQLLRSGRRHSAQCAVRGDLVALIRHYRINTSTVTVTD
jgi:hypothetical protein